MKVRITEYLVPRLKLAFGRVIAGIMDCVFLREDPSMDLIRIGTDYGGWYCCRFLLGPQKTALCCGAGEDISFDVALNGQWGMRIICVDPTPRAICHIEALLAAHLDGGAMLIESGPLVYDTRGFREDDFVFVPRAVWSKDGFLQLFAPKDPGHVSYSALNLQHTSATIDVRASTVESLLSEFSIRRLSLLKLDIEGAEYQVIRSMLAAGIHPDQLLVEFDQVNQPLTPFFWIELSRVLRALRDAGYQLIRRENANYVFVHTAPCGR